MDEPNWVYGEDNNCSGYNPPDPVHEHLDGTWWFYDETWGEEQGPFKTRAAADEACKEYAEYL